MTTKLQTHENAPWLGSFPNDWTLLPVRAVLKERKEKNTKLEESNILSVMKGIGVIRYEDKGNVGNKSSERPEAYKIVCKNDLVLNSMNLSIGSVGMAREDGVTSSVYIIYQARPKVADPNFYHYLFQTTSFQRHLASYGRGIMELREAVKERDIKNQSIVVPPLETQKRIVDFLAAKTKTIDELVAKKKRMVELLKEKRTVQINKLIMNVKGEWSKIKACAALNPGKRNMSTLKPDDLVSFVPMEALSEAGDLNLQERAFLEVQSGFTYFENGDVVLAKITPCYENGKAGVMKNLKNGFGFGTTEFLVMRPNAKILPEYLYFLIFSDKFRKLGEVEMRGTAGQKRVSIFFVRNYEFTLPSLNEQTAIIKDIKTKIQRTQKIIKVTSSQIKKLNEYRSSLIYSAVTGKIKV